MTVEPDQTSAFKHNGKPLYQAALPESEFSPADDLVWQLVECGIVAPDRQGEAREIVELAFDRHGDARAADALRVIVARLEDTAAGLALRRALSGDKTPLRDAAEKAGVSHVAVWKQERTIAKRIGGLTSSPIGEGT